MHTCCLSNTVDVRYLLKDSVSYDKIQKIESSLWHTYETPVYQKKDEAAVWFRIQLDGKPNELYTIQIPSILLLSTQLYGSVDLLSKPKGSSLPQYKVKTKRNLEVIYLKVVCGRKSFVPIEVVNAEANLKQERNSLVFYVCYYSFAFAVFLFTLLSFYQYRDKSSLIYIVLMLFVNVARNVAEGDFSGLIGDYFLITYLEQFFHGIIALVGYYFTVNYIEFEQEKRKKLFRIVVITLVASNLLLLLYLITHLSWLAFFSDVFVLLGLNSILFFAASYYRKSAYAKFYCFAYFPLMFAGYDIYFLEPLGIKYLHMGFLEYRIGMAIEMLILTISLSYKGRAVILENETMKQAISKMAHEFELRFDSSQKKRNWGDEIIQEYNLTKQEFEVLKLILEGKRNQQIADKLFVSLNTIKFHTKNIYSKLEINSRKQVHEKVKPHAYA